MWDNLNHSGVLNYWDTIKDIRLHFICEKIPSEQLEMLPICLFLTIVSLETSFCQSEFTLSGQSAGKSSCRTVGGPSPGKSCQFPFTFAGVTRSSCISDQDPDGKLWCSTKVCHSVHKVQVTTLIDVKHLLRWKSKANFSSSTITLVGTTRTMDKIVTSQCILLVDLALTWLWLVVVLLSTNQSSIVGCHVCSNSVSDLNSLIIWSWLWNNSTSFYSRLINLVFM